MTICFCITDYLTTPPQTHTHIHSHFAFLSTFALFHSGQMFVCPDSCALMFEEPDKHAHMHKHPDSGLQITCRLSAGTLGPVLFQLGSYQCVWWVVIRRYNISGSWPAKHNGGSITAITTKSSHSQQPTCPWNGEWDRSGKITSPGPSNEEFGQPYPHSGLTLFSYTAWFCVFKDEIGFHMWSLQSPSCSKTYHWEAILVVPLGSYLGFYFEASV